MISPSDPMIPVEDRDFQEKPAVSRGRKKRNTKLKKDPNAPKRFRSAYIIFSSEKHNEHRKDNLGGQGQKEKITSISKLMSKAWNDLSKEEKEVYEEKARQDKLRFERERAAYSGPWKVEMPVRAPKDPRAPKRPMSAYLSFSNGKRIEIKQKEKHLTNGEVSKILSRMWKELPDEERQKYVNEESRLRQEYRIAINKFQEQKLQEESIAKQESAGEGALLKGVNTPGEKEAVPSDKQPQANGKKKKTPPATSGDAMVARKLRKTKKKEMQQDAKLPTATFNCDESNMPKQDDVSTTQQMNVNSTITALPNPVGLVPIDNQNTVPPAQTFQQMGMSMFGNSMFSVASNDSSQMIDPNLLLALSQNVPMCNQQLQSAGDNNQQPDQQGNMNAATSSSTTAVDNAVSQNIQNSMFASLANNQALFGQNMMAAVANNQQPLDQNMIAALTGNSQQTIDQNMIAALAANTQQQLGQNMFANSLTNNQQYLSQNMMQPCNVMSSLSSGGGVCSGIGGMNNLPAAGGSGPSPWLLPPGNAMASSLVNSNNGNHNNEQVNQVENSFLRDQLRSLQGGGSNTNLAGLLNAGNEVNGNDINSQQGGTF